VTSRPFRFSVPTKIAPVTHGYAETREAAMAAFVKSWRCEVKESPGRAGASSSQQRKKPRGNLGAPRLSQSETHNQKMRCPISAVRTSSDLFRWTRAVGGTRLHRISVAEFRRPRVDWSLIWFGSDLDPRSVAAWLADFPIRVIWPCGLWSEPGLRWIIVSRDAVERGVDSGPQSPQRGILVKERMRLGGA
jgi:hypothetical protein